MTRSFSISMVVVMLALCSTAQKNVSFDQLSFSEPANWTFTDNGAYHSYTTVNKVANTFCIISVYNSDVSLGNLEEDFRKAWKGILVSHFTVSKEPAPQQNNLPGGLTYLQDQAGLSNSKGNFFARLLVFNLKGKAQPVLFLSLNQDMLSQYKADLDRFTASLQQNNAAGNSTTNNTSASTNNNGTVHFNHFIFKTPGGWKSNQQKDFFMMTAPNLETDEMLFYVMLPPSADTSFDNAGEAALKEMATGMNGEAVQEQIYGKGPLYIKENADRYSKGWEFSLGHGIIRLASPDPNNPAINQYVFYHAGVFLVKIHARMERVMYISKDIRRGFAENSTYRKLAYEQVIKNFFFDLDFDDWNNTKTNSGLITHSGVSNLWGGLAYFEGSLGSVYTVGSVKATYLAFFNNGQVYYNKELPKEGFNQINTYTQAALFPRWWGTYTYQNGAGVIKLSYTTIPFTLKDGKIYLEMYQKKIDYSAMPNPDGIMLEGNWCGAGVYNGKTACIRFTANGQFEENGVIKRVEHEINTAFNSIPESGQGTYEIKNNSIIFHYSNGFTYQAAFSGLSLQKGSTSPAELHLGYLDDVFEKQ